MYSRPLLPFQALLLSVFLAGLTGCMRGSSPDEVSVRLKWTHNAQHAGLYVAAQKGFFRDEGMKVSLREAHVERHAIETVASGDDHFGFAGGEAILVARGKAVPVRAVAVIYRENPMVFFSLKGSGIKRAEDFAGKTVAVARDSEVQYRALLERVGLLPEDVTRVPHTPGLGPLLDGQIDVDSGYLGNEIIECRLRGYDVNVIYPIDYGIRVYADTLFATEQTISESPDLVERFLRAVLRGWRYAIEHPEEAADMALKYDGSLSVRHQRAMLETIIPLVHGGERPLGWMDRDVWLEMRDLLFQQGLVDRPVDPDEAHTMQFLESIYRQ